MPVFGLKTAPIGRSFSGGARIGFDSFSFTGGVSHTSLSLVMSSNPNNGYKSGVYFKAMSYPSSETVILSFDNGSGAYVVFTVDSAGVIRFRSALEYSLILTVGTVPRGVWAWVSMATGVDTSNSGSFYWGVGAWWYGVAQYLNRSSRGLSGPFYPGPFTCSFSVGYSPSGTFANAPNNANILEFSRLYLNNNATEHGSTGQNTVIGPPSSNWGAQGSNTFVYNCNTQPLGAATSLLDNSGNGYNLPATSQGLTILIDGPFL